MEELNRKELAELLGVSVRTVTQHKSRLGYKDGKYDPANAVRSWIEYQLYQLSKEYDKTSEIKQYQLEQEREKAFKLRRENEILQGEYIRRDEIKELYDKIVYVTKTKILGLKPIFQRKLSYKKLNQKQIGDIVDPELRKALEELSQGDKQNGKSTEKPKTKVKRSRKTGIKKRIV